MTIATERFTSLLFSILLVDYYTIKCFSNTAEDQEDDFVTLGLFNTDNGEEIINTGKKQYGCLWES